VWSASGDQSVRGWDPDNGQLLHVLTGHNSWVRCVLAVDEFVWSGADDASIKIWHQQTGRLENDLRGHTAAVHCLLRVGLQVWSGGADKVIRVWAAQGGRLLKELRGHESWVNCLLLREPFVWSGSSDRSIRLWNAASGACYKVLRGHSGWVWCMAGVGPDRVWSGSGDKSIRVWRDVGANDDGVDSRTAVRHKCSSVSSVRRCRRLAQSRRRRLLRRRRCHRSTCDHAARSQNIDVAPQRASRLSSIDNGDDSNDDAVSDGGGFASHSWLADRRRNNSSLAIARRRWHACTACRAFCIAPNAANGDTTAAAGADAICSRVYAASSAATINICQGQSMQYNSRRIICSAATVTRRRRTAAAAVAVRQRLCAARTSPMAELSSRSPMSHMLLQRKRELVSVEATLRSRRAEALELERQLDERQLDAAKEKQQAVQKVVVDDDHNDDDDDLDRDDKEIESVRAKLAAAEQQLADALSEQRRHTEAGDAVRRELDDVRRHEQELQRELAGAQSEQRRLAALAAESANAQDSHAQRVERLRDDLTASEARRERAETALAEVQALRDRRVQSDDNEQRAERAAADERIGGLVTRVSELERVVAQRESSLSAARESLLAARERIATLEADLLLSERHVAAAQQRAADDAAVFEQRIQVAESRSRDLALQLSAHTQRAEAVEESHRVLASAFAETVASQRELERQIELYVPLEAEVEMLRSKLDSLRLVAHTVASDGVATPASAAATMTPAHRAVTAASARASQQRARHRAEAGREQMLELSTRLKTLVQHATAAPAPRSAPAENVAGVDDATKRADAARVERLKQARAKLFGSTVQH
jgi:hypothetical protein